MHRPHGEEFRPTLRVRHPAAAQIRCGREKKRGTRITRRIGLPFLGGFADPA